MKLKNWNLRRLVYLVFGLLFFIQLAIMKEWLILVLPSWMIIMAVFNLGCCGTDCAVRPHSARDTEEVVFEEVK